MLSMEGKVTSCSTVLNYIKGMVKLLQHVKIVLSEDSITLPTV